MIALARTEGLRLLRHPAILVSLLVLSPLVYWATADPDWRYPVLHDADQWTQPSALLFGAATLLVSNLAVTRAHRSGATEMLDVLTLPPAVRTAAHLLALLPLALVTGVLVSVHMLVLATVGTAAGSPNPFELATGPVVVLLFGAIGVLLGRIVQSAVVAPLLTVVFAAATFVLLAGPPGTNQNWFLPIVPASGGDPLLVPPSVPADLMTRPAAAHLLYLVGLLALAASIALLLSGGGGKIAATIALAVTVAAGALQSVPPDQSNLAARITATQRPATIEHCRQLNHVNYCAFDGFDPWIKEWDAVVQGVLRRMPPSAVAGPVTVRQRVYAAGYPDHSVVVHPDSPSPQPLVDAWRADDQAAGTPDAITVGTRWGDGWSETSLAGRLAYDLIAHTGPGVSDELCGARGVLVGWLAGQATEGTRAGLHTVASNSRGGIAFLESGFPAAISLDPRATALTWTLLERPDADVARQVLASWAELSAPGTTVERAAQLFGVATPASEGQGPCG